MNIIKIKKKHYNNLANFLSKYFVPKKNVEFYKKKFNYYIEIILSKSMLFFNNNYELHKKLPVLKK